MFAEGFNDDAVVVRDDRTDASTAPCEGCMVSDMHFSSVQDTLEMLFLFIFHLQFIRHDLTKPSCINKE